MRIGIIGKGGSGKTSVTWLLAQAAYMAGHRITAIDADYNQHLAAMFGVDNSRIAALAGYKNEMIVHALGARSDVTLETFRKDLRPADSSGRFRLAYDDELIGRCLHVAAPGLQLLRVGEYLAEDQGEKCYHARTGVVDILLNHLQPLAETDHVFVDYTAGIDPVVSRLAQMLDALVLVVEPTRKGVAVVAQWQQLLAGQQLPLYIVGNKIAAAADAVWLSQALADAAPAALLWREPVLVSMERDMCLASYADLLPENQQQLQLLLGQLGIQAAMPVSRSAA